MAFLTRSNPLFWTMVVLTAVFSGRVTGCDELKYEFFDCAQNFFQGYCLQECNNEMDDIQDYSCGGALKYEFCQAEKENCSTCDACQDPYRAWLECVVDSKGCGLEKSDCTAQSAAKPPSSSSPKHLVDKPFVWLCAMAVVIGFAGL